MVRKLDIWDNSKQAALILLHHFPSIHKSHYSQQKQQGLDPYTCKAWDLYGFIQLINQSSIPVGQFTNEG